MLVNLRRTIHWIGLLSIGISVFVRVARIDAQEKSDRKLIKKVEPVYPPIASKLHLAGTVKLALQIAPEGRVSSVRTVGGNPILAVAAEDAAKQWKYEAAPKESSTLVTLSFEAPK